MDSRTGVSVSDVVVGSREDIAAVGMIRKWMCGGQAI